MYFHRKQQNHRNKKHIRKTYCINFRIDRLATSWVLSSQSQCDLHGGLSLLQRKAALYPSTVTITVRFATAQIAMAQLLHAICALLRVNPP